MGDRAKFLFSIIIVLLCFGCATHNLPSEPAEAEREKVTITIEWEGNILCFLSEEAEIKGRSIILSGLICQMDPEGKKIDRVITTESPEMTIFITKGIDVWVCLINDNKEACFLFPKELN